MLHQTTSEVPEAAHADAPYKHIAGDPARGALLLCDHAFNALPVGYGTLGLPPDQLARHIAYDIGAAGTTQALAGLLDAPAVLARYSRLLIDPNRGTDDPTLVMRMSDGTVIPGNAEADASEIAKRVALYHAPYHAAIDAAIDAGLAAGRPPVLISIHSFTHAWKGKARPWQVTVLWDKDPRFAKPLLEALRAEPGLAVGENEPYSGKLRNDTLYRHGTNRGLAHALIEIRQDLICVPAGQREWGERLGRVIAGLLRRPDLAASLYRIEHYGSHTDAEAAVAP